MKALALALALASGRAEACLTLEACLDEKNAVEKKLGGIHRSISALQHPPWPRYSQPRTLLRATQNGAEFRLAVDAQELLGESWKDQTGLIWGDIIKDMEASTRYMNQRDGARQCKLLRARLPTVKELKRLSGYMIIKCPWCQDGLAYQAQVLPNLRTNAMWSSTVIPDDDAYKDMLAYVFHPTDGRVYYSDRGYANPIRCVRQAQLHE